MGDGTSANDSKTFVLRLSSEGEGQDRITRISHEDPVTRARRVFESLRDLGRFLAGICNSAESERSGEREGHAGRARRGAAVLAFTLSGLIPVGTALGEAPRISLGQVDGRPGAAVAVPVLLRSGDSQPIGALSLRVRVEPAFAADSISFRRAGAWAERRTTFEARPQAPGSFSWVVSLAEPVAAGADTLVGEVVVRLARGLAPGTEIRVFLDPAVSGFGDRAGTRFVSAETGGLVLEDGSITLRERTPRDDRR